jgi:hypothetical protein
MKYFALAMLLAVLQTAPPAPRKAPDNASSSSKNIKQDSGNLQTPSVAATPQIDRQSGETPTDTHAQEATVIRESAPVPKPGKDWWDKAYVIFTGLLVIVGGLAVGYAVKTLRAIERQALSMRRQTTHLRNSVIQARRAANAAKKSADFAELATKLAECADVLLLRVGIVLNPRTQRLDGDAHVELEFKNFGRTRADDTRFTVSLQLPDVPDDDAIPEKIAVIMGAGDTQIVGFHRFREWLTQETFDKFLRGEIVLRFSARAAYDDVFGESHSAQFSAYFDHRTRVFRVAENKAR